MLYTLELHELEALIREREADAAVLPPGRKRPKRPMDAGPRLRRTQALTRLASPDRRPPGQRRSVLLLSATAAPRGSGAMIGVVSRKLIALFASRGPDRSLFGSCECYRKIRAAQITPK